MDSPINLTKVKQEIKYEEEEEKEVCFEKVEMENCFAYNKVKKEKDIDQGYGKENKIGIEKVYIKEEVFDDWEESTVNENPLPVLLPVEAETITGDTMTVEETKLGFNDNFPSISQRKGEKQESNKEIFELRHFKDKYTAMRNIGLQPVNLVVAELQQPKAEKSTSPLSSHKCHRCGKTYKNLDGLRKHTKLYCGQKPRFLCLMCPKKFYQKIHVRSHMFAVHGTVTV